MRIQFSGWQGKRVVGNLEWDARNQFVCEVADAEMIMALLTEPQSAFCIADDDPLWQATLALVENAQAAKKIMYALLEIGVGALGDMATWTSENVEAATKRIGESLSAALVQRAQDWQGRNR